MRGALPCMARLLLRLLFLALLTLRDRCRRLCLVLLVGSVVALRKIHRGCLMENRLNRSRMRLLLLLLQLLSLVLLNRQQHQRMRRPRRRRALRCKMTRRLLLLLQRRL